MPESENQYLSAKQICAMFGFGKSKWAYLTLPGHPLHDPTIPKRVKFGRHARWLKAAILAWAQNKKPGQGDAK